MSPSWQPVSLNIPKNCYSFGYETQWFQIVSGGGGGAKKNNGRNAHFVLF